MFSQYGRRSQPCATAPAVRHCLLELARADAAEPGDERADLAGVLAAIAERHRRLGIDVRLALAPGLGTVAIGEETLDTILSNLLDKRPPAAAQGSALT